MYAFIYLFMHSLIDYGTRGVEGSGMDRGLRDPGNGTHCLSETRYLSSSEKTIGAVYLLSSEKTIGAVYLLSSENSRKSL